MSNSGKWSEPIELDIYLTEYGVSNVAGDPNKADIERVVRNIVLPTYADCVPSNWKHIGRAQISISLLPGEGLVAAQVEALQRQERKILAEAQAKCTDIRRKINTLLAITNEVQA